MRLRALRDACVGGFLYGALLYGAVLSLVHVLHNHVRSAGDALIAFGGFGLIYGLWAAVFFGLVALAAIPFPRPERRGLLFGLLFFNLTFWELFFLYGLTYDQAPLHPAAKWGMAGVLLLLALPIALGAALGSWLLWRLLLALRPGGWKWAALALLAVGVGVHAAAPLYPAGEKPVALRKNPPAISVQETGLKVVFVGFDGADWRVIRPMMDRGELPAFAGMVRNGATGPLASIHDSNSAVIWASIYSGMTPERHGVLDFYRVALPGLSQGLFPVHRTFFNELADFLAPTGFTRQVPVDRFSMASPPFWELADRAGLSIGVVDGYFYSFPALRPSRPESWFLSYGLDEMAARPTPEANLFVQPVGLFREYRPLLDRGDFGWQSSVLLSLLDGRRPQPRLVNFYTHQPDSYQHWYWKWYEPERFFGVTEAGLKAKGDLIPGLQRGFDRFLGQLLARVGPDTVVIVASDHGHSPTIVHSLYTQHRHGPPGILLMQGGPVRRGLDLQGASVYDLYPTVLYLLGLPVPEDAAGKVLTGALDPAFVQAHPIRTVPTYRDLGFSPNLPGAKRDGAMNEAEIQKLRALGYL